MIPTPQPVLMQEVSSEASYLPVTPNVPFLLRHKATRVEFHQIEVNGQTVGYWLPTLVQFPLQPGTNKIKTGKDGEGPDYTFAKAEAESKREWVFLDPTEKHDGEPVLTRYPAKHPKTGAKGNHYCTLFDRPEMIPGKKAVDWENFDDDGYARWLHSLVVAKKLPKPSPYAIREKLRQQESKLNDIMTRASKGPYSDLNLKTNADRYEAMKAALVPGDESDPLLSESKGGKRGSSKA